MTTQTNMIAPTRMNVDGKVWTNNQVRHVYRVDFKTGQWRIWARPRRQAAISSMPTACRSTRTTISICSNSATRIGRLDAKTKVVKIWRRRRRTHGRGAAGSTSRPPVVWRIWRQRHRHVRSHDRADQGVELPTPWSAPYDVRRRRTVRVWTGSMLTDPVSGSIPQTGEFMDYLLPHSPTSVASSSKFHEPAGTVGRQQPRRRDRQGGTAGLSFDGLDVRLWCPTSLEGPAV